VNSKTHPNDRFIPRRIPVNFDFGSQNSQFPFESDVERETEFINYAKVRYNRTNYQNALKEVLMPLDMKILNFFPPKKFKHNEWTPADEGTTSTNKRVQHCVKWKNDGMRFAVGLFPNKLGVWDIVVKKLICETFCCLPFCEICSLEWINDNCLVTGCNNGVLKMHTADLKCIRRVRFAHDSAIINIASSCNRKLIATSGTDRKVIIWKVPELEGYFQITFPSVVRALAWHPWRSALLATGLGFKEGRVILWNVNTHKDVISERNTYKNSSVDCLTFNPITAELVVSYFVACGRDVSKGSGVVSVLSNINKVVEELHIHNGPVPYLLWGDQGRVLASISADENLCIWSFFGSSDNGANLKKKKEK
ncbi:cell division cycle protein 20 -like protein, partial [Asbolus verrucosus]